MQYREENNYVWLIAYIDRDNIQRVERELKLYKYNNIEVYIPMVKILQKKFKGKNIFEEIPLLFNYGFIRVSYDDACNHDYLQRLKSKLSCIYAWVYDQSSNITYNRPGAAIAKDKEVEYLKKKSKTMGIFTSADIDNVKVGHHIILQGYPFENIHAEVLNINHKKQEVRVKIDIMHLQKEVTVSFENVFYTIYKNFDENGRETSTEEIDSRAGYGLTDNLLFNEIETEYE